MSRPRTGVASDGVGRRTVRRVQPLAGPLDAVVRLPGSKSITNRALVIAALAEGESRLDGVLLADDIEAMLDGLGTLGIGLTVDRDRRQVRVVGAGGRLPVGPLVLDARLSGTTSRFLLPVLALGPGPYRLDGAAPLRARPIGPSVAALTGLGATIVEAGEPGHLPLDVLTGVTGGGRVRLRGDVSSQFVSGLLLAGPCYRGGVQITLEEPIVSRPYLDLTVSTMAAFGLVVDRPDANTLVVPAARYEATTLAIEPDASAASYFFAAAAIAGGSVRVEGIGRAAVQGDLRFVDVLERMGASVTRGDTFIEVRGPDRLHGVNADLSDFSDTAQTLAAVAVFADGPTEITGIGFIRRKETDRIAAVVTELRRCGIDAEELDDGVRIAPGAPATPGTAKGPKPAVIRTYDDHRMAMSFALLGLRSEGIEIADPGCVAKTFPDFWDVFDSLRRGGNVSPEASGE
jgi:3-phosphoshikimate 1-carboxyvinyltransferase